ncbi:hypothetical protein Pint_27439 [Pistacia integerrima]|uniref:Uncharacterized protein n=1 Tax=Pistacia integerrima TaxID=434235 RepID=A0ACC0YQ75_9ROSI|nr:hypothetical protein Pint_27439 [Pistacia integerrima]
MFVISHMSIYKQRCRFVMVVLFTSLAHYFTFFTSVYFLSFEALCI